LRDTFQHMRSHNDLTALSHSFYDVINASSRAAKPLRDLRRHCLNPGLYEQHLQRWLDYFDISQVCFCLTVVKHVFKKNEKRAEVKMWQKE